MEEKKKGKLELGYKRREFGADHCLAEKDPVSLSLAVSPQGSRELGLNSAKPSVFSLGGGKLLRMYQPYMCVCLCVSGCVCVFLRITCLCCALLSGLSERECVLR